MRNWALDVADFSYDSKSLKQQEESSKFNPAIIDTGSSFVAVPPSEYK